MNEMDIFFRCLGLMNDRSEVDSGAGINYIPVSDWLAYSALALDPGRVLRATTSCKSTTARIFTLLYKIRLLANSVSVRILQLCDSNRYWA